MNKLICPNCGSKSIRINKYASDNIFGFSKSRWYGKTGKWVCENCGTFIKGVNEKYGQSPTEKSKGVAIVKGKNNETTENRDNN